MRLVHHAATLCAVALALALITPAPQGWADDQATEHQEIDHHIAELEARLAQQNDVIRTLETLSERAQSGEVIFIKAPGGSMEDFHLTLLPVDSKQLADIITSFVLLGSTTKEQAAEMIRQAKTENAAYVQSFNSQLQDLVRERDETKFEMAGWVTKRDQLQTGLRPSGQTGSIQGSRISTQEAGQNRYGGDYNHYSMSGTDPNVCEQSCLDDNQCRAWTYVRPGVQGDQAVCWLKSSVPELSNNDCCTSGKIDGE